MLIQKFSVSAQGTSCQNFFPAHCKCVKIFGTMVLCRNFFLTYMHFQDIFFKITPWLLYDYILRLLTFVEIRLFNVYFFRKEKRNSGKLWKKCGMRDSREKGAGMRDQDLSPPSRPCFRARDAFLPRDRRRNAWRALDAFFPHERLRNTWRPPNAFLPQERQRTVWRDWRIPFSRTAKDYMYETTSWPFLRYERQRDEWQALRASAREDECDTENLNANLKDKSIVLGVFTWRH